MRGNRDLRLAVGAALACALLAAAAPFEALSLLFAAPLALFLPGYAIVAATFARQPLEAPMRIVLSLGLSLAVLTLGGIVLNYTPGGIRALPWTLLLLLVVAVACHTAALRRPSGSQWRFSWPWRVEGAAAAMLLGGLCAAAAALVLCFTTLPAKDAIGFTELWMQPGSSAGGAALTIGVGSNEQRPTAYRLRVSIDRNADPVLRRFALDPGESRVLRFPVGEQGAEPRRVLAELFREASPGLPYRRASAWIPAANR